ncbi:unnamed protein product [Vitrella brassicaformis CCMP3155]|uniref:Exonuclease domain-containing protein n=1 Tax=Vitrella brassicaformis (strain CCMP3155) TaxID=1169540 RepID=A0A0G4E9X7_VITBC|nr:unnamed protein product [Vitrella brassicaformis CCMP3155]|eukprot:CEL92250.1 unnamed protein product [Vitrella brassicaformis CCMP3155]
MPLSIFLCILCHSVVLAFPRLIPVACRTGKLISKLRTLLCSSSSSSTAIPSQGLQMNTGQGSSERLESPLVWIDLEMTGLDTAKDMIIEAAVVVTDGQLERVIEGPDLVIYAPDSLLDSMDEWCTKHHGESGLTDKVRRSTMSLSDAEEQILAFIRQHAQEREAPLAGNSVHVDRRFLVKDMPKLERYLHYRIVDVSTVKELCRRWYPALTPPLKKGRHRALEDIRESIEELKFYRSNVFREVEPSVGLPKHP